MMPLLCYHTAYPYLCRMKGEIMQNKDYPSYPVPPWRFNSCVVAIVAVAVIGLAGFIVLAVR